jgi:hypothetical protein
MLTIGPGIPKVQGFMVVLAAAPTEHNMGETIIQSKILKNAVFWDVKPRGSCYNRRFGGTCRFHLHGRKTQRTVKHVSSNNTRNA